MATNIRERAKEILSVVPPLGQQINSDGSGGSDGKTDPRFEKLTGKTHSGLLKAWDEGSKLTTCNEFVGWFGTQLGSQKFLGQFPIKDELPKWGRAHAWVDAASGARPKYGDIFRPKKFHMGISLDFEGNMWNTVESGQGGRSQNPRRDIIKRKQDVWKPHELEGWIDIELFFGPGVVNPGLIPDWLPGWWTVTWLGKPYYYHFDKGGQVKWTKVLPKNKWLPPQAPEARGTYAVEFRKDVTIQWFGPKGSVEKFSKAAGAGPGLPSMQGKLNGRDPLSAVKM